jgi:putative DNA-directed RNA polymerase, omega subunit
MNGFILVAVKLLIGFFALIMVINITGKGNLAPNSASDQVQNYVLGGIIGGIIYNKDIDILECIAILFIWFILVIVFRIIKERSVKARQIIDGKARIIIEHGKVNVENCKKAGLCAHDVAFKLRTNNIYSTHKVKRAVVEQNGQLIIILAGEENPKFPIITDGSLQTDILEITGKSEEWLLEHMKKQGFEKYSEIFLGEYVDGELIFTGYN